MIKVLKNLIYQTDGPLTDELKQAYSSLEKMNLPSKKLPEKIVKSVCGYCSTGCCLDVHIKNNREVNVTPTRDYPVNVGFACPKGWDILTPLYSKDRGQAPLLKNASGRFEKITWPQAMEEFVSEFKWIQKQYGPESLAFLSTGQIVTEEMFFLGILTKFGMGFVHGDSNTRQCMATSAVAYKESFGFDAPPYSYEDFELSDVIIFIGANPCIAHPIMWERVKFNPLQPKIIVIDPRTTETAVAATKHYAINPKSDLMLFYGLAKILVDENWIDREFIDALTNGFAEFIEHLKKYPIDKVSKVTGISQREIFQLAQTIHQGKRVSFWWTMGVNQSHEAVRTAQAIINLALMTGNIGKPGTGANSITGQCNAMGSRLFSNTTNLIGGHSFINNEHRKKIAKILNIKEDVIPYHAGWTYDQIIKGIDEDKIKGLWIIATNPSHSWINQNDFKRILKKLDFLVVQDMYFNTDTALEADLYLPAAGWGEKEGTFINSERRFGYIQKVKEPPGEALSDFDIFKKVALAWGCDELVEKFDSPQKAFELMKKVSIGQPCDISGMMDYKLIESSGGIQWPCLSKEDAAKTHRRLFEDGKFYHPDRKGKFVFEDRRKPEESTDQDYPFILLTGRGSSAQWHTQTKTSKSAVLKELYSEKAYVEINPEDARELNIKSGEIVEVKSRRGKINLMAMISPVVKHKELFIPMHYAMVNQLTLNSFDPYSKQPSYKYSAVALNKIYDK